MHPPVLPLADEHPAEVQRPLARHAHGQRVVVLLGLLLADGEVLGRGRHRARPDHAHRPVGALVDDVFREAHIDQGVECSFLSERGVGKEVERGVWCSRKKFCEARRELANAVVVLSVSLRRRRRRRRRRKTRWHSRAYQEDLISLCWGCLEKHERVVPLEGRTKNDELVGV